MRLSQQRLDALASERGLKMTPQRRAIVEYLERAFHHPTADDVFVAVNERFPLTSRATVYNTLNLLKEASLVREISRDGVVRFDPNLDPHHHFVCRKCGKVEDLAWDAVPPIDVATIPGDQRVESFDLTLHGLCGACEPE
jgi:Fur family transcriptional regulator, peroxide stress response regulator